jgi:hypothetical protein
MLVGNPAPSFKLRASHVNSVDFVGAMSKEC